MHALVAVVQNAEPRFRRYCRIPQSFHRREIVMLRRTSCFLHSTIKLADWSSNPGQI
jgi:hypothetical protein